MRHVEEIWLCPRDKWAVLRFEGADPVVKLVAQNLIYAAWGMKKVESLVRPG